MEYETIKQQANDDKGKFIFWDDKDFDNEFDLLSGKNHLSDVIARILRCYVESWEEAAILKKDPVSEAKLLRKYGGLQFYDIDTKKMFFISDSKLHWMRPTRKSGGYSVMCFNEDYSEEDNKKDDNVEPFAIFRGCPLHELLTLYYKKEKDKGVIVVEKDNTVSNDEPEPTTTSDANTTSGEKGKECAVKGCRNGALGGPGAPGAHHCAACKKHVHNLCCQAGNLLHKDNDLIMFCSEKCKAKKL